MHRDQAEAVSADLSFRDLMGVLRRQRMLVLTSLVVFVALAAGVSLLMAPKYRSTSDVLIEDAPKIGVVDASDPLMAMEPQEATFSVPTQVEVLQSNDVLFEALTEVGIPLPRTPDDVDKLPRIRVQEVADTNVIEVSVDAKTEELAQKLATALPSVYREYVRAKQQDAVVRGLRFVDLRTKEEREALAKAAADLSSFKEAHKVVDTTNELNARLFQSNQADQERTAALAQVKAAQGELDEAIKARKALPEMLDVPSSQTNAVAIENAKLQLEALQQQRKQLLVDYREDSVPVRKADEQIKSQQAYIASLSKDVRSHVKSRNPDISIYDQRFAQARADLKSAQQRAAAVVAQAAAKQGNVHKLNDPKMRDQQELERRVTEHQTALLRLADTGDRLRLQDNSLKSPVSNITEATIPIQVAPRWLLNIALGIVLGLVFGCFLGLARDAMQDRVNTERDVRWASGLDILARMPLVPGRVGMLIWRSGDRLALDRFRLLRSNLVLASEGNGAIVRADDAEPHPELTSFARPSQEGKGTPAAPARGGGAGTGGGASSPGNGSFRPSLLLPYDSPRLTSLVVTSTFQSEGKSTVAANLATAMAMDERRVILVDANLRAPSVHKSFGVEQSPGLSEVLHGKVPLEEALRSTEVDGLRVLPSGELPLNPSGVLASTEMLTLHEKLKSMADVVIYDTVSSYALADAQALAAIVGSVLLVSQLGVARKDDMREAVTSLAMTKARVLGVVLNRDPNARTVLS